MPSERCSIEEQSIEYCGWALTALRLCKSFGFKGLVNPTSSLIHFWSFYNGSKHEIQRKWIRWILRCFLRAKRTYLTMLMVTLCSFCGIAPKKKMLLSYQMHYFPCTLQLYLSK
jgi:hypothetical protein